MFLQEITALTTRVQDFETGPTGEWCSVIPYTWHVGRTRCRWFLHIFEAILTSMRWIEGGCFQKKESGHKWNMTLLICWCVCIYIYIYDHIHRIYTPDITVSFSSCSIILMSHLQHPTSITFSPAGQDIQQQQEKVASQSQQVQQMQQDFQLLGGKCWKVGNSTMEVVMITIILCLLIYYVIISYYLYRASDTEVENTRRKLRRHQSSFADLEKRARDLEIVFVAKKDCCCRTCPMTLRSNNSDTVQKLLQLWLHTRSNNLPYNAYQCASRWITKTYQERSFNLSLTWIGSLVRWMISQPYLIFHWGRADGTRSRHRAASGAEGVAEKRSRCWANARGSVVPSLKHSHAS